MFEVQVSSAHHAAVVPWAQLLSIVPHVIWASLLLFALRWLGKDHLLAIAKRIGKVSIAGVEIQFLAELHEAAQSRGVVVPGNALGHAARRLAKSIDVVRDARVLWVDDHPQWNRRECQLLRDAGAHVTQVQSTDMALKQIRKGEFDLVLSDVERDGDREAGLRLAQLISEMAEGPPVIFYTGKAVKPVPASSFGMADQPAELLHLILDALSRTRS